MHHVAIVSESDKINFDDVSTVAAAVAKQVTRDFGPAWGIQATVQAFGSLEAVPSDYYQVILVDDDKLPGAAGYHTDTHGQPLAVVEVAGNWPLAVSHEVLEMVADPFGCRIVSACACPAMFSLNVQQITAREPKAGDRFDYLVEVCDPVQASSYAINGIPVADFVLPEYYSSKESKGAFFCTVGSLELGSGGYITFRDNSAGVWRQIFSDYDGVRVSQFSGPYANTSIRETADRFGRASEKKPIQFSFETASTPRHVEHAARTRSTLQKASLHGGASAK